MAKKTEKNTKKTREEIREEIKRLSEKADSITPKQLKLVELDDEDVEFDTSVFNNTADPDKSYKLYYGMLRLMKDNLPKDKAVRRYVYDEKNIYLNRGKRINAQGIRRSDGRMAFITPFLEIAFDITANWVKSGSNPFDLYEAFRQKNEEMGYYDNLAQIEDAPDTPVQD